jgi:hypothetical protein
MDVFEVIDIGPSGASVLVFPHRPDTSPAFSSLLQRCSELMASRQARGVLLNQRRSHDMDELDVLDLFLDGKSFTTQCEGQCKEHLFEVADELGWMISYTTESDELHVAAPAGEQSLRYRYRLRVFTTEHKVVGRVVLFN